MTDVNIIRKRNSGMMFAKDLKAGQCFEHSSYGPCMILERLTEGGGNKQFVALRTGLMGVISNPCYEAFEIKTLDITYNY